MPLDNLFDNQFKRWCLGWELKTSLYPRRCFYSNKLIWLEIAYKGTAMIPGPGEPVFIDRWISRNEFLIAKIKGLI